MLWVHWFFPIHYISKRLKCLCTLTETQSRFIIRHFPDCLSTQVVYSESLLSILKNKFICLNLILSRLLEFVYVLSQKVHIITSKLIFFIKYWLLWRCDSEERFNFISLIHRNMSEPFSQYLVKFILIVYFLIILYPLTG